MPYNEEAKELIERLEKEEKNVNPILRKLQKYTVSVYSSTERMLSENHSFRILDCGASVTGRMNISMYTELMSSDSLRNIEQWHPDTSWNRFSGKKKFVL